MADTSKDDDSRSGFGYMGVGLELAAAVAGFSLFGWWIGGRVGGERGPVWGLLIGFVLGFVGGMYNLLKATVQKPTPRPRRPEAESRPEARRRSEAKASSGEPSDRES